jgi:hypothetical protein
MLHLGVLALAVDGLTIEAAASVQALFRLRCLSAAPIGERSGSAGLGAEALRRLLAFLLPLQRRPPPRQAQPVLSCGGRSQYFSGK